MLTCTHTTLQLITSPIFLPLPVGVGPLVEVLLLSPFEVQLLASLFSQLIVLTHIVQGPHIQPLVQHRSPINAGVITDIIISVDLCCSVKFSSTTFGRCHVALWDCYLPLCSSRQHRSNNNPSNEQCEEQEGHHCTCQYCR